MVDPKLAFIVAALALTATPVLAQDDPHPPCDRCAAPQARWAPEADRADDRAADRAADQEVDRAAYGTQSRYVRQTYTSRSESYTRTSYSEGFLSWPGKDERRAAVEESDYRAGPEALDERACPPVKPGERVISCHYRPFAPPADITPMTGVLFADGGVGPEFIPGGGGGGGGVTIIGSGNGNANASASASAIASASASISIDARFGGSFHHRGGYGGGPKGCGCTTSGYGGMSGWGGGSMGGGSHGHGRR